MLFSLLAADKAIGITALFASIVYKVTQGESEKHG
jgi:hypothetical protein